MRLLGMKKFEYMGKQWHEQCFCCQECRQPISNKSFIPRDQHVVCITCYEQQYAQRCTKCSGVSLLIYFSVHLFVTPKQHVKLTNYVRTLKVQQYMICGIIVMFRSEEISLCDKCCWQRLNYFLQITFSKLYN